jgi:hypothetical protein
LFEADKVNFGEKIIGVASIGATDAADPIKKMFFS